MNLVCQLKLWQKSELILKEWIKSLSFLFHITIAKLEWFKLFSFLRSYTAIFPFEVVLWNNWFPLSYIITSWQLFLFLLGSVYFSWQLGRFLLVYSRSMLLYWFSIQTRYFRNCRISKWQSGWNRGVWFY